MDNGTDMPFYRRIKSMLPDSPLEISEIVAVTNAPCTFDISSDHRTFVSSKCSECTICRMNTANPFDKRFQKKRRAFVAIETTPCSEKRH